MAFSRRSQIDPFFFCFNSGVRPVSLSLNFQDHKILSHPSSAMASTSKKTAYDEYDAMSMNAEK